MDDGAPHFLVQRGKKEEEEEEALQLPPLLYTPLRVIVTIFRVGKSGAAFAKSVVC